jgi:hypothetical protein
MKRHEALSEFERLVAHYRPMLGVDPRTQITFRWDRDTTSYAEAHQTFRRRTATLRIGRRYGTQSYRDRCQTAIHELLHLAQHGMVCAVHETVGHELLGDAGQFELNYDREVELFTDTLAEALVDVLPKP